MKTPHASVFLLLCALGAAAIPSARADDTSAKVALSDPAKPCTLKIRVARGELHVRGADTNEVTVVSDAVPEKRTRKDGLRVLTSAASYSLTEKDNVVTLVSDNRHGGGADGEFKIIVPRSAALQITDLWGGEITCADLKGDLDIRTHNGEVNLTNVSGGATVETMNGEITAKIAEVHEGHPLCFTSMNGKVAISMPAAAKANVRLRTQNGAILTDFDEKTLVTKTQVTGAGRTAGSGDGEVLDEQVREQIRQASKEVAEATREAAKEAAMAFREAAAAVSDAQAETDTDEGRQSGAHPVPPVPPMPAIPALPTLTGGKIVSGTLNGGGVDLQAATMNGDVIIRKY